MSRSLNSDPEAVRRLYEALELVDHPKARFHVRQAIQLEQATDTE